MGALYLTTVVKSADEAVTANATPQNDNELVLSVGAGETWEFEYFLVIDSDDAGSEFKAQISTPASSSGWMGGWGLVTTASAGVGNAYMPVVALGSSATWGTYIGMNHVVLKAIVITTNSGAVTLQWSNNGGGGTTTVKAGSFLRATKFVDSETHTYVVKATTESLTSDNALQNDDELFVPVSTGETWEIEFVLKYDGGTGGDFSLSVTAPAGTTMRMAPAPALGSGASSGSQTTTWSMRIHSGGTGDPNSIGCSGTDTHALAVVRAFVIVGANSGNVRLVWSQLLSSATATRVFQYSYIKATRIAVSEGELFGSFSSAFSSAYD